MLGFEQLFKRTLPVIMLICFVAFGISITFQQIGQNSITYLEYTAIEVSPGKFINNYTFNFKAYIENIDQDILKRSVEHTLQIDEFKNALYMFEQIWADGYQIFDVSKTIANALIMVIDGLILPINILLVPVRLISGFTLTALSLLGINIDNGRILCPMLNYFVDNLAIPMIDPQILQ